MIRSFRPPLLCLAVCFLGGASRPASAQMRESVTVDTSTQILSEMMSIPEQSIPPALLQGSHAIAIIPNVLKAGFLFGGCFGRGILVVRDPVVNAWSNPIFVTFGGGSFGFQAGAQATDLVLVFRNRRSVDSFLLGRGKFTLGADAAVAAGPLGRRAAVGTDVRLSSEILTYSRSRGLFAGVSLEGAALHLDTKSLAAFYNQVLSPGEVLQGHPEEIPVSAARLKATVAQYTGATPNPGPLPAAEPDVITTAVPVGPTTLRGPTQPPPVLNSTATGPRLPVVASSSAFGAAPAPVQTATVQTSRRWRRPVVDPDFLDSESPAGAPATVLRGQSSGLRPEASPTPAVLRSTPTSAAQDSALTPASDASPRR